MKKLLRFLRGYRAVTVLGPLFKLLEAVGELIIPLVVAAIIDKGITAKSTIFGICFEPAFIMRITGTAKKNRIFLQSHRFVNHGTHSCSISHGKHNLFNHIIRNRYRET